MFTAPEKFPNRFLPWQERILARRLQDYRNEEGATDIDLAADIETHTGYKIGNDTVRRFLDRQIREPLPGEQKSGSAKKMRQIAVFLMHENIGLLSLEELVSNDTSHAAPNAFLRAVGYNFETQEGRLHPSYAGSYLSITSDISNEYFELSIDIPKSGNYFHVQIVNRLYMATSKKWHVLYHDGWGIVTPQNCLLIHTKNRENDDNEFWISVAKFGDFCEERTMNRLVLLELGDTLFLEEDKTSRRDVLQETGKDLSCKVQQFQCIDGIDYEKSLRSVRIKLENNNKIDDRAESPKTDVSESLFLENFRFQASQNMQPNEAIETREECMDKGTLGRKLHKAVMCGDSNEVKRLFELGVDVNYKNHHNGNTALHFAASDGLTDIVELLEQHPDFSFTVKNKRGDYPSALAYIAKYHEEPHWDLLAHLEKKEQEELAQETPKPNTPDSGMS